MQQAALQITTYLKTEGTRVCALEKSALCSMFIDALLRNQLCTWRDVNIVAIQCKNEEQSTKMPTSKTHSKAEFYMHWCPYGLTTSVAIQCDWGFVCAAVFLWSLADMRGNIWRFIYMWLFCCIEVSPQVSLPVAPQVLLKGLLEFLRRFSLWC